MLSRLLLYRLSSLSLEKGHHFLLMGYECFGIFSHEVAAVFESYMRPGRKGSLRCIDSVFDIALGSNRYIPQAFFS